MSLVSCKECGKEVASTAPICPNCGVTYPGEAALGSLRIHRKAQAGGSLVRMDVSLNDRLVASLGAGEKVLLEKLGKGNYSLKATLGGNVSQPYEITISAGHTLELEISFERGFIKNKLLIREL